MAVRRVQSKFTRVGPSEGHSVAERHWETHRPPGPIHPHHMAAQRLSEEVTAEMSVSWLSVRRQEGWPYTRQGSGTERLHIRCAPGVCSHCGAGDVWPAPDRSLGLLLPVTSLLGNSWKPEVPGPGSKATGDSNQCLEDPVRAERHSLCPQSHPHTPSSGGYHRRGAPRGTWPYPWPSRETHPTVKT